MQVSKWLCLVVLLVLAACRKPDAPSHLERAKAALFERKPLAALAEFNAALDLLERDTSPQGVVYRARALRGAADTYYFELNDYKRAVEVYRELIQLCPEAPETLDGRIHLATLLDREFHDVRGSIAELTAALARNPPQSAELAYRVATRYFSLQDYEQCELEARSVTQKYETSAYVDDALFLRGQALAMMDGRKLEAQRVFMDLIDRFPDSELKPHALYELGRLKTDQGENERAIELWVEALKLHPDPNVVQGSIARVRSRLRATTPDGVGDALKAFDWAGTAPASEAVLPGPRMVPRTSVEAAGGTAEEAEAEANMKHEPGSLPPAPEH
ncbi:MAG: tetratricopeptide repeat protein [Archangium sp.]|nr:tetratricopeptide repeat protein [Archangium sp.]